MVLIRMFFAVSLLSISMDSLCENDISHIDFCEKVLGAIKKSYVKPAIFRGKHRLRKENVIEVAEYKVYLPVYFDLVGTSGERGDPQYTYEYDGAKLILFADDLAGDKEGIDSRMGQLQYALSIYKDGVDVGCASLSPDQVLALYLWGGILFADTSKQNEYIVVHETSKSFYRKYYDLHEEVYVWEINMIRGLGLITLFMRSENGSEKFDDIVNEIYEMN